MKDPRLGLASASKMDRIAHCPGSLQAEREFSLEEKSDVASEGDAIHDSLAVDDLDNLDGDQAEIAKRLKDMREKLIASWRSGREIQSSDEEIREQRFWIHDGHRKVCSAQLDYAEISGGEAIVIDYKSGYRYVTPSHKSYQIRTQAVSLWKNKPHLRRIRGCIASYRFREHASQTDYTTMHLVKAEREIKFLLWRAEQPDAERVPGPWCTYCKAKSNCPAAAAMALLPVPNAPPQSKELDQAIARQVCTLSLDQLAYIQNRRAIADKIFVAVTNRLRNFSEEELASVGLRLLENNRAKVNDVSGAFKAFIDAGLLRKEECAGCCNVIVDRIAKLAIPRLLEHGVSTKKAAAQRVRAMLDPFLSTIECAKKVVKLNKKEIEDANENVSE